MVYLLIAWWIFPWRTVSHNQSVYRIIIANHIIGMCLSLGDAIFYGHFDVKKSINQVLRVFRHTQEDDFFSDKDAGLDIKMGGLRKMMWLKLPDILFFKPFAPRFWRFADWSYISEIELGLPVHIYGGLCFFGPPKNCQAFLSHGLPQRHE